MSRYKTARISRIRMMAPVLGALLISLCAVSATCLAQTTGPAATSSGKDTTAAVPIVPSTEGTNASADTAEPQSGQPSGAPHNGSRVKTITRPGPVRESWASIELGTKYFRGIVGGLEQGASLGLGLQATTADLLPAVEFRLTAITSVFLYRRFEGEAYVPKVFNTDTHADLWFDYLRRIRDNFFGIGPKTPEVLETNYDREGRSYAGLLYHNFTQHFLLGGYFRISNTATYKGQDASNPSTDEIFSGDPNTVPASAWAPGLHTNVKLLSYGGFAQIDLRNNTVGLTKGAYFYARVGSAQGLKNKEAFSDFGWLDTEFDARGYVPLGSNKTSLALRGYSVLKDPRGNSQIPFYALSFLGGRMYGRGFKDYRFRGDNFVLGSVELRQTVWTQKEDRGLDLFAFGDAGQVWGDNRSQTDPAIVAHKDFDSRAWKSSIGGGIQYRYSHALAGRIEVGHSNETNAVYFSIGRGF